MARAFRAPTWLDLGLTHRARYEYLWNQFRTGFPGHDRGISLRTTAWLRLDFSHLSFRIEGADSRLYGADLNAPLNDTLINPVELIEATGSVRLEGLGGAESLTTLRAGRMTLDLGSRRLVARNRFRNTFNTFTGLDLLWQDAQSRSLRLFALLPVNRLPDEQEALRAHRVKWDQESLGLAFLGGHWAWDDLPEGFRLESYLLGLIERDRPERPTRNRRLATPGFRLWRRPAPGRWDAELELAVQLGRTRGSTAEEDHEDLSHLAAFSRASLGYTAALPWSPRTFVFYDYASGDTNPEDGQSGRFDTLYGARRFEYGPTGIYGAFGRANLSSPGLRLELRPSSQVDAYVAYRAVWLASAKDAWPTAGLRDPTGGSGRFVGQQFDTRVRFRPLPGNVAWDVGAVHTWLDRFPSGAAGDEPPADPSYVYFQVSFEI